MSNLFLTRFSSMILAVAGLSAFGQSQPTKIESSENAIRDFSGRLLPSRAAELVNLAKGPDAPGIKPAALPGWTHRDGIDKPGNEFPNDPLGTLRKEDLHIEALYKLGQRVGVIRKFHPDLSWQIMDVFRYSKDERMTAACDSNGHSIPPNHLIVGILRQGDPRRPPKPPRPNAVEQAQYLKDNFGRFAPRACLGDLQEARIAATLNLKTGRLIHYAAQKVTCVSPFFDPCAPDGIAEKIGGVTSPDGLKAKSKKVPK